MRKSLLALMTGISMAAIAPANAAIFTDGNYSFNFNGITESYSGYPDPVPGLAATIDLVVTGAGTDSWTFAYTLSNLADSSIWDSARVSALGFNVVTGGFTGGDVDGTPFDAFHHPGGFPFLDGLGGTRDVCINGNDATCQGGGGVGPTIGAFITGSFTLDFDADHATIELDDGIIRWQSLYSEELGVGSRQDEASGIGLVTEVPEPATWMTMIAGFGMVGFALRRRRRSAQVLA